MKSTSYTPELLSLITSIVKFYNPKDVIEFGVQQGGSGIALGRGMSKDSNLVLCDKFSSNYDDFPHGPTHANYREAIANLDSAGLDCNWTIKVGNYIDLYKEFKSIDIVHLDFKYSEEDVREILPYWLEQTKCCILMAGAIDSPWQVKYSLKGFRNVLSESWVANKWSYSIFQEGNKCSLTVLTPKH